MTARFIRVEDEDGLAGAYERSQAEPVLLFLHDPWCPISERAYEEVERLDREVFLLDVSEQRKLSKAVEAVTGVKHESPQAIVIAAREPRWNASHGRIRTGAVETALGAGAGAPPA